MKRNKKTAPGGSGAASSAAFDNQYSTPPILDKQQRQVLELISANQPLLSFEMTANCAIPGTFARIHELREMGFNIITQIVQTVVFRGQVRRRVAKYSIGSPAWPSPEFKARHGVEL